jgi:hypothetical protein
MLKGKRRTHYLSDLIAIRVRNSKSCAGEDKWLALSFNKALLTLGPPAAAAAATDGIFCVSQERRNALTAAASRVCIPIFVFV